MKINKKLKRKEKVKIVCLGDSITYGFPAHSLLIKQVQMPYPKALELDLKIRYDYDQIEVINSGEVGFQSDEILRNLNRMALNKKPDLCIVMFGINDSKGSIRGGVPLTINQFKKNYQKIIDKLKKENIEILLLTPTRASTKRIFEFVDAVIEIAEKNELEYINMFLKSCELLDSIAEKNSELIPDKIHFRDDIYQKLANIIVKEKFSD